jgi:hypothetical protein
MPMELDYLQPRRLYQVAPIDQNTQNSCDVIGWVFEFVYVFHTIKRKNFPLFRAVFGSVEKLQTNQKVFLNVKERL